MKGKKEMAAKGSSGPSVLMEAGSRPDGESSRAEQERKEDEGPAGSWGKHLKVLGVTCMYSRPSPKGKIGGLAYHQTAKRKPCQLAETEDCPGAYKERKERNGRKERQPLHHQRG